MYNLRHSLFILCIGIASISVSLSAQGQDAPKKSLTLEAIHHSNTFSPASFNGGRWAEEGPIIWYIEQDPNGDETHLMSFNLETDERIRLIDGSTLYADDVERVIAIDDYAYSANGSTVLIYTDSERVWRSNTKGYYYIYSVGEQTLQPVAPRENGFQMFAKLSPAGDKVAFVRNRNLFVVDLESMEETPLTFDGEEGSLINGTSDWVYEEEFRLRDGWAWSPDGRYIAFFKFDESGTRDFFMTDLLGQYPEEERFRYPKAGEQNSEVKVGVIDMSTRDIEYFETKTWFDDGLHYEYIPQMGWTPAIEGSYKVWMIRLNRDQNVLDLLYGDPESGEVSTILREEETTWIDVNSGKLQFLSDDEHFIWMSEADGYRHIYLYANTGDKVRQVTTGRWEVAQFAGIDEQNGMIYFTATKESPLERQLYGTSYHKSSSSPERISEKRGTHRIDLSRDAMFYIDSYSSSTSPPVVSLHEINGREVKVLEDNQRLFSTLTQYDLPEPEFITVPGADEGVLNGYLIKPSTFDPSVNYPLMMYVYGGPGSQTVTDSWGGSRYLWHAMLANELNVIVASVDNRGTGGRGKAFKGATYKRLGQLEAEDQVAAASYLGSLPYVDQDRIGIWGWSYGGYMTLMSMLKDDGPNTFKFGVSVAPVTDWGLYDTIYTERYMSTPQSNAEGYKAGAPLEYADHLKPHQRLLLVHGDFDDNVHFQNAAQMANELQAANKQFEFMMYPGRNHGIFGGNTRLHLHTMMTQFIRRALNEPSVPTSPSN